ncbi:trace amine-associated receptor 8-like [Ptychodera flava]|uniref:trace amine-associated receptor 8-like n=1 Tax=Ptychodera flava TaxID=63121 RepID=UPI00396A2800
MAIPCIVTVLCYCLIFVFIRRSRQRVQAHGTTGPGNTSNKAPSLHEIRALKVMVVVFLLILLSYLPIPMSVGIHKMMGKKPPISVFHVIYSSQHIAGSVNPILYGMSNKRIRDGYKSFLSGEMIFGRECCRVEREDSRSSS